MLVYLVQHVRPAADDSDSEEVKVLGIFSSEAHAIAAIQRACARPGFDMHPEGFHIARYEVDHDYWCEGFVSIDAQASNSWAIARRRLSAAGWIAREDDSVESPHAGIVIGAVTFNSESR